MKSLLNEIRSQPPHIREIFMWLCVVITASVIGWVWFKQTQEQFVALLHPEQAEERALAEAEDETLRQAQGRQPSPFATLFSSFGDLQANIYELFAGSTPNVSEAGNQNLQEEVPPQELPIAE